MQIHETTSFENLTNQIPGLKEEDLEFIDFMLDRGVDCMKIYSDLSKFEKSDESLDIFDFDDVLVGRKDILEKYPILAQNRGEAGNKVIVDELGGFEKFAIENYSREKLTPQILEIVGDNVSMILTAGIKEYQEYKIRETGLSHIHSVVVDDSELKPMKVIEYVHSLGYVPSEINIFDDRVVHFKIWGDFLARFLGTKINVYEVELEGKNLKSLNLHEYLCSDDYYKEDKVAV